MKNSQLRVPNSDIDYDENLIYRYAGQLFTGFGEETMGDGKFSEIEYRNGLQHGWSREWSPTGILVSESHYKENVIHGDSREFSSNGKVQVESKHEYGIKVSEKTYDSAGNLVSTYRIDHNSTNYRLLERYRSVERRRSE